MSVITIIMPAYNVGRIIGRTIDSILAQSFVEWELIIVNDGSTDNTEEILVSYAERYPNIRYITIENSGSARKPRLLAAEEAATEWVCNIDADDYIEPQYLEKLLDIANKTGADTVCPIMKYVSKGKVFASVPSDNRLINKVITGKDAAILSFSKGTGSSIATGGMLSKKVLYDALIKDKNKSLIYQDEIDDLKVLIQSKKVAISEARYYYEKNENSITHTVNFRTFDKLITEVEYKQTIYDNFDSPEILRLIDIRFLDTLIHRRWKYLKVRRCFTEEERQKVDQMFRYAYSHLNRTGGYKWMKKTLLCRGYRPFKFFTAAIFLFIRLNEKLNWQQHL